MALHDSSRSDLKDILLKEGILNPEHLNFVLKEQEKSKQPLLDVLIRVGKFDEKKLVRVMNEHYGFTAVNPSVFVIDRQLIRMIPKEAAEKYTALPMSLFERTLTVAFANPLNLKAVDEVQAITKMRIKVAVSEASILKRYIDIYYTQGAMEEAAAESARGGEKLDDIVKMIEDERKEEDAAQTAELMKVAYETPVIKLVNMLLLEGVRRRASDIFVEPWENHVRVRARVDGLLEEMLRPQKSLAPAIISRIKVMSDLDIAEHRIPQDGRFKVKISGREIDMRISILPTSFGEKACLRILDTKAQSHDISKLGFSETEQQVIKDSAQHPHGMILVTGPTGSGKTTTLYSVLEYLHAPEVNITTVEDPVEYQMAGINQVNVKDHIGLTFPAALRSILRQDPDIILIGEIRDNVTLDIAVKAALTGHLVLSTLHTNDSIAAITRMVNMGLEPFLIASTVLMISAQRLVRRVCTRCRGEEEIDPAVIAQLGIKFDKKAVFYKGKGCAQCRQTGYAGRSVITELLQMTPDILELITRNAMAEEIKEAAKRQGMTTLRECALRKALAGETTLEEVFRVTGEEQVRSTTAGESEKEQEKGDKKKEKVA